MPRRVVQLSLGLVAFARIREMNLLAVEIFHVVNYRIPWWGYLVLAAIVVIILLLVRRKS